MARERIVDQLVRRLAPPTKGNQIIIRDTLITGFAVRITSKSHVSFIFNYVCNGVQRRMTIGSPPSWSVAAAREEAKRLRRFVDIGGDPLQERVAARNEETLSDLWPRYKLEILSRRALKTQSTVTSIWDRIVLPALGNRKLSSVGQSDIERLHSNVSSSTPTQSNRMLASLQHFYSKAIQWGLVSSNPVKGVERNSEERRERYLSNDELHRFLNAVRSRPITPSTLAIQFLLLTGARSGETFKARWCEFDLSGGVWVKPSAHTKRRRLHRVPLSSDALAVLEEASRIRRNEHVFPGKNDGNLTTVKKVFSSIIRDAGIQGFRPHDLRHTFASMLVQGEVSLPTIGRLLGHTQVSTTNRYSHLDDSSLRLATSIIGERTRNNGK